MRDEVDQADAPVMQDEVDSAILDVVSSMSGGDPDDVAPEIPCEGVLVTPDTAIPGDVAPITRAC